ncbi:MAG: transglycosylase SLT domain-containing protein [Gammaproteobacteria bacterium]
MNSLLRKCLAVVCALSLSSALSSALAADGLAEDRARFLEARKAFKAGQSERFQQLAEQLRAYPLYPYLRYDQLNANLARARDDDVRGFLDAYADSPLAERLRRNWLTQLARQHQWQRFQGFYAADQASVELQCHYLWITREDPPPAAWLDAVQDLWLVGKSQPDACNPIFKIFAASPRMTEERVWQRIDLAMQANAPSLASFLARLLPAAQRKWVDLWREAHQRPASALDLPALRADVPQTRAILAHAVQRLARNDAEIAWEGWARLRDTQAFTPEQQAQTLRTLALQTAYKRLPEAHLRLAAVPEEARDRSLREWQARSALLQQDWSALLASIDAMPAEERQADEWRYWRAQALSQLGDRTTGQALLGELAGERSYHGFLAADALGLEYRFLHQPIAATETDLSDLQQRHPALRRAGELLRIRSITEARREWAYGIRGLTPRELALAAALAHSWDWHDRAIITAGRSDHLDDLEVRFPVLHVQAVERAAARLDLDPAWIMGVMRQESAFMNDARSPVGALGLMQLMPATGSQMARLLKLPEPSSATLMQADTNIQLGSHYLRHTLDSLGNKVLATAAYNAGPHRVRRWLPEAPVPTPLWVDTIPFSETRGYVRAVLAFATVYDERLQRPIQPLRARMPETIDPRGK